MIRMTRVPEEVTRLLAPLKPYFSYRHHLVFCWLLVAHLMCFGKATVQGLARYAPTHVLTITHNSHPLRPSASPGSNRSGVSTRATQ
jgi:hypothetical protein